MTQDEFVTLASEYIEEFFPKGKTKMRGEAMVLVSMICAELLKQGVLNTKIPTPEHGDLARDCLDNSLTLEGDMGNGWTVALEIDSNLSPTKLAILVNLIPGVNDAYIKKSKIRAVDTETVRQDKRARLPGSLPVVQRKGDADG